MTGELPRISVVVPVYNGARTICRCLDAIISSEGIRPEVVVVDDASTDNTSALVERYPVTLLRLTVNRGPAHARNLGAKKATGDILFFVDADVEIRSSTVHEIAVFFSEHPHIAAVIGSYDADPGEPGFLSQYRNLLHHFIHQQSCEEAETFWSGCGALRRDLFFRMNGFRETFIRPLIEDIELGVRIRREGHRIRLLRRLQVKHLKKWGFLDILKTDVLARGIPWTLIIMAGDYRADDLNLQRRYRWSAVAVILTILLIAVTLLSRNPAFLLPAAGSAVLYHMLNRDFFRFLSRERGVWFAVKALPMFILYYIYSSAAFAAGGLLYLCGRRIEEAQGRGRTQA